jgi:hypothetical protein
MLLAKVADARKLYLRMVRKKGRLQSQAWHPRHHRQVVWLAAVEILSAGMPVAHVIGQVPS